MIEFFIVAFLLGLAYLIGAGIDDDCCPRCGYYCNNSTVFCTPPITPNTDEHGEG